MKFLIKKTRKYHFPFFMSLLMSGIMSFVLGALFNGINLETVSKWPPSWMISWVVAFPIVIIVTPVVRRLCHWLENV